MDGAAVDVSSGLVLRMRVGLTEMDTMKLLRQLDILEGGRDFSYSTRPYGWLQSEVCDSGQESVGGA
jgi:hypothetical protein